jgi:hypothetical protein
VVIAMAVFMMLVGLAFSFWARAARGLRAGQENLDATTAGSYIAAQLRRDLLAMAPPEGGRGELMWRRLVRDGGVRATRLLVEEPGRPLRRELRSETRPAQLLGGERLELAFQVFDAEGERVPVHYVYQPEGAVLVRTWGDEEPEQLAPGRVRDFSLDTMYVAENTGRPVRARERSEPPPGPMRGLWFELRLEVRPGEATERGGVAVETRVFPRPLARALCAR